MLLVRAPRRSIQNTTSVPAILAADTACLILIPVAVHVKKKVTVTLITWLSGLRPISTIAPLVLKVL